MEDAEIRLLVLDILVSIIDRHDNRHKFTPVRFGHTDQLKTLGIYNVPLKKMTKLPCFEIFHDSKHFTFVVWAFSKNYLQFYLTFFLKCMLQYEAHVKVTWENIYILLSILIYGVKIKHIKKIALHCNTMVDGSFGTFC